MCPSHDGWSHIVQKGPWCVLCSVCKVRYGLKFHYKSKQFTEIKIKSTHLLLPHDYSDNNIITRAPYNETVCSCITSLMTESAPLLLGYRAERSGVEG